MIQLFDNVAISGTRRTTDGYLVADVRVARTGIQDYLGSEVDPDGKLGLRDKQIVRVYRPESEVFSEDSMQTYAYRPVTDNHPSESVTADNWKRLSVGQTGGDVARDGDWLRVPMAIMDSAMIAQVAGGKRQLSMGYTCVLDATPGVTEDGQSYDAIQRNLRMNHLAVVAAARAGASARIGDGGAVTGTEDKERKMPNITVDGLTIETTDQGAQVIVKLQKQLSDAASDLEKEKKARKEEKDASDREIAQKDAEIVDLGKKILSGDAMDAAVAARADLLAVVSKLAPSLNVKGLSDADIRRSVVVSKFGDSMKEKSDAYIDARFDMMAEGALVTSTSQDHLRHALSNPTVYKDAAAEYNDALDKQVQNLNAHRQK